MNTPYFSDVAHVQALENEACRWVGTPFAENSAVPGAGGGVSCHFLVAAIYKSVGALPAEFNPPRGSARNLIHGPAAAMLQFIDANLSHVFEPVANDPVPGDMIVMSEGHVMKHVGIVLPGRRIVHVLRGCGVVISLLDDSTFGNHIAAIRRPIA